MNRAYLGGDMGSKLTSVLFDKDGTLVDFHATWAQGNAQAVVRVAERFGSGEPSVKLLMEASGLDPVTYRASATSPMGVGTTLEIAESFAGALGNVDVGELKEFLEAHFLHDVGADPIAVDRLEETLAKLASDGLRLGVATMDSITMADAHLDALGIRDAFEFVCGYDSGYGQKPGPGMLHAFSQALDIQLREVVMVGDSPHDLHMGRAAGAGLVVGVLTGVGTQEELVDIADMVVPSIADLPELIDATH